LRHVTTNLVAGQDRRRQAAAGGGEIHLRFWSADWSPWRALAQTAARWPVLHFDLHPIYDMP
jgi:hypothetical protein